MLCPSHSPLALVASYPFTDSIVCLFQNVRVGITQCVAFSDRLLSLSNWHLSFFRVFSWLDGSFLFGVKEYSIAWTTVCPSFPVWAVMANAAVNTRVQASRGHKFSPHLDEHQEFNTHAKAEWNAELIGKGVTPQCGPLSEAE